MSISLEKALYRAAALTFEQLGFMLPSPELAQKQLTATPKVAVTVRFLGPVNGRLTVLLCGDLLPAITANMLGEESSPTLEQQHDALREIANVICGNMLPLIAGTKPVFNVDFPQVMTDPAMFPPVPPLAFSQLGIEGGRAELKLFVDNPKALEELPS
jgi:CheY-specific phosphatase CheX